jgi:hypothetical protein
MRSLRFARTAAQAELFLLRRQATLAARRAILAAVAAVFALAALAALHVLAYMALRQYAQLPPIGSASCVLGADLAVTLVLGLMAASNATDPMVEEARMLRDQSFAQAREGLRPASLLAPGLQLAVEVGAMRMLTRTLLRLGGRAARG